jgi:CDP-glucose 4,6-dehydratase
MPVAARPPGSHQFRWQHGHPYDEDVEGGALNPLIDKCYRNDGQVWGFRENDPLGGHDPYSASKAGSELVVDAYRFSFFPLDRIAEHGVRLASVRAGNVIGGGDWAEDRIVPDAMRALAGGADLVVRNPGSTRPW